MVYRTLALAFVMLTVTGCSLFEELDDGGGGASIEKIRFRAFDGDVVWSRDVDREEHAIDVDELVPVDAVIEIEFKSEVDFELARRHITLEELDGPLVGVDLRKSDERIQVEPTEALESDTWHVLFIDEGIETEGGKELRQHLRVEFETER